jgi:hypothetical protein
MDLVVLGSRRSLGLLAEWTTRLMRVFVACASFWPSQNDGAGWLPVSRMWRGRLACRQAGNSGHQRCRSAWIYHARWRGRLLLYSSGLHLGTIDSRCSQSIDTLSCCGLRRCLRLNRLGWRHRPILRLCEQFTLGRYCCNSHSRNWRHNILSKLIAILQVKHAGVHHHLGSPFWFRHSTDSGGVRKKNRIPWQSALTRANTTVGVPCTGP